MSDKMEYSYENGTIYEGTNPIATVVIDGYGLRTRSITISGQVQIKLERQRRGFNILDNGMMMGTANGFTIEYLGTVYEVNKQEVYKFVNGRSNSFKITSQGSEIAEVSRKDNRILISTLMNSDKVPLFIYLSFLSPYSNPVRAGYARNNRRGVDIPIVYKIAYYVLTVGALIFLFSDTVLPISYADSLMIFLAMIIAGYVVRYYGVRKGRKKDQSLQQ
ncbi:MAG: hypothetical protein QW258_01480 [Thermoplasmata archaeon]